MKKDKDYDAPRNSEEELIDNPLEAVQSWRGPALADDACADKDESGEDSRTPLDDFNNEELVVRIIPPRKDEFMCSLCFLVHHRSRLVYEREGVFICAECDTGNNAPEARSVAGPRTR